ncbi:MAG: GH3 auxin-responsive promoter family protein [Flavobacteriaceae bacterium]|nr:GH3 auxin-responsive promoter family protein [Flavobacteriaceae bacterium]
MKNQFAKYFAQIVHAKDKKWIEKPAETQQKVLKNLLKKAENTTFGKDHNFENIQSEKDFKKHVPIRDYEQLKPYIDKVVAGETNILWPGKPKYFAKTSGTTSGTKYIPISKDSMPYHIKAARSAVLNYINYKKSASIVEGKMIFLQGSPVLEEINGIKTGRLSGIVAHYVPSYLQKNRMPSFQTNCIEAWEEKLNHIVQETLNEDMRLISGIPPWILMYFEKLNEIKDLPIGQIFPNLEVIITGGVNYEPYRQKMQDLLGRKIDVIQTYPASEGFIAYQDQPDSEDLLLLLNNGIYYEFIPVNEFGTENPTRLSISEVQTKTNYALLMSTNAGLWGYSIGDTVEFTSLNPYRIRVTGRIKHFTSAFGEHVIAQEVEKSLSKTLEKFPAQVSEFHVAPQVNPEKGLPYHEWLIEFKKSPENLDEFRKELDRQVQQHNVYYFDLIEGKVLQPLVLSIIRENGFNDYMKSIGKLGGQFKLPRLANDRKIADEMKQFIQY